MATLSLRLTALRHEAEGVCSCELQPVEGGELPAFTAGAHVDLHLAPGLVRSYSLCNSQDERHRYVVAVNRDARSRGGSRHVHEQLRVGQVLQVGGPRNNFPLDEGAPHSVLVAGGIGITPLLAMVRRLVALDRPWELHYCARSQANAAFLPALRALQVASTHGRLHPHFDDAGQGLLDLGQLVAQAPAGAHFYCCGPGGMLTAFEAATAHLERGRVHLERFTAPQVAVAPAGGFTVELARSGRALQVEEGRSILDTLLDAGVDVPYSCMQGICGACETRVLAGEPEHRDLVRSAGEHRAGGTIILCCSGAKTQRLVLDL